MEYKKRLNEYIVDDIFSVIIYRSISSGLFLITIICTETGQIEHFRNIESVPTIGMINNFIKQSFNYGD